jgi:hypothetical protein
MKHIVRRGSQGICEIGNTQYGSLQGAISSIPENGSGAIVVNEDLAGLSELILNAGSKITINCGKLHSLTFTSDIVELGNNQELHFHEMSNLSGGKMEINGASAILMLVDIFYLQVVQGL